MVLTTKIYAIAMIVISMVVAAGRLLLDDGSPKKGKEEADR